MSSPAVYQAIYLRGEFTVRIEQAREIQENCRLCPRHCNVNRLAGKMGACHTGDKAIVSNYAPHFGEETPLVGKYGSGTIFFANCNLNCVYCQNFHISQLGEGRDVTSQELAKIMLSLQERGCHNINLVTPTHIVPQILQALGLAIAEGLSIPLVYNCGGYESVETLRVLEGIVDIYMPDMKYSDDEIAREYSGVDNYPSVNKAAIKEMHRQVGDLQIDGQGIATRGLLVRHLVLPHRLAGTSSVVHFLAEEVSPNTYINIMAQYRPCYKASKFPSINKTLTRAEFSEAVNMAHQHGLERLDGIYAPREKRVLFL